MHTQILYWVLLSLKYSLGPLTCLYCPIWLRLATIPVSSFSLFLRITFPESQVTLPFFEEINDDSLQKICTYIFFCLKYLSSKYLHGLLLSFFKGHLSRQIQLIFQFKKNHYVIKKRFLLTISTPSVSWPTLVSFSLVLLGIMCPLFSWAMSNKLSLHRSHFLICWLCHFWIIIKPRLKYVPSPLAETLAYNSIGPWLPFAHKPASWCSHVCQYHLQPKATCASLET